METRTLTDVTRFDPAKMQKNAIFESPHMFFDLYCLEPGQAQKVHAHEGADKVYLVMEGSGTVVVGDEERVLAPGTAAIARAGQPHGIRNDGPGRLVALVTMAPPPARG